MYIKCVRDISTDSIYLIQLYCVQSNEKSQSILFVGRVYKLHKGLY